MAPRLHDGIYLGSFFETTEHVVAMADGRIIRTGAVQQVADELLWSSDKVMAISAHPWNTKTTLKRADVRPPPTPAPTEVEGSEPPAAATRAMPITREIIELAGYTDHCRKCRAMRTGDDSQPSLGHSAQCRQRIREFAKKDPEL